MRHHTDDTPFEPPVTRLTDDWSTLATSMPAGLVLDCREGRDPRHGAVAVYRDRLELIASDAAVDPLVLELAAITSWRLREDPPDAIVDVVAGDRRLTRVPLAYAGVITAALGELLGDPAPR